MASAQQKLLQLRSELNAVFLEREKQIDGLLACLLSQQNILFLGPPGTAKSNLAQSACGAIKGASYFPWLLTKYTTPEEVFGPISVKALQNDEFIRKLNGKLPTAHVAFLDECFKASSSILNSLLTLVNERLFYNGSGTPTKCPLITVVGASNELPEGSELDALFDRFILRYWIDYLESPRNMRQMLLGGDAEITTELTLTELQQMQIEASKVAIPDVTIDAILSIRQDLADKEKIVASDRRWKQILKLLKAYAYLQGDAEVTTEHFIILPDALWRNPKERGAIMGVLKKVGNPATIKANELLDACTEAVKNLGQFTGGNAGDRGTWAAKAAAVMSTLDGAQTELSSLVAKGKPKVKAVVIAQSAIAGMRNDVVSQMEKLFTRAGK